MSVGVNVKIRIICVGKLKEKYLLSGINEYVKRLKNYCKVEIIELADESIPNNCSLAQEEIIKDKEGKRMMEKIKADDYVIVLDVASKQLDSIALANKIETAMIAGKSTIDFIIGGSLGHGKGILKRADLCLSFSKLTFPHQLMRLILVEQIYRSFKIIKNETYHK